MMVVEMKKQKVHKSVIKRELRFQNYKNCLEANQLDNKIKYPGKNKTNIDIKNY